MTNRLRRSTPQTQTLQESIMCWRRLLLKKHDTIQGPFSVVCTLLQFHTLFFWLWHTHPWTTTTTNTLSSSNSLVLIIKEPISAAVYNVYTVRWTKSESLFLQQSHARVPWLLWVCSRRQLLLCDQLIDLQLTRARHLPLLQALLNCRLEVISFFSRFRQDFYYCYYFFVIWFGAWLIDRLCITPPPFQVILRGHE